jgi:hypothetical protein
VLDRDERAASAGNLSHQPGVRTPRRRVHGMGHIGTFELRFQQWQLIGDVRTEFTQQAG